MQVPALRPHSDSRRTVAARTNPPTRKASEAMMDDAMPPEAQALTAPAATARGGASASEMVSILRTTASANGSRTPTGVLLVQGDSDSARQGAGSRTGTKAPATPSPRRSVMFSEGSSRLERSQTPPKRERSGERQSAVSELEPEPEPELGAIASRVTRSRTPPKHGSPGSLLALDQEKETLAALRGYHGDSSFGLGDIDKEAIFSAGDGSASSADRIAPAALAQQKFRETIMDQAEQAFRTDDFGTLRQLLADMNVADRTVSAGALPSASSPARWLDMYRVHMIKQMGNRSSYLFSFVLYMVYMLLLGYLTLYVFPESSTMLRQREAVDDMFLSQEFSNNETSSTCENKFVDVADQGGLWQFMYGPMVEGIWTDPGSDEPGMMLLSNFLVGAVQVRQVRVDGQNCSALAEQEERMLQNPNELPNAPQVCYPPFRLEDQYSGLVKATWSTRSYGRSDPSVACVNGTATCRYHHSWHPSSLKGSTTFATGSGQAEQFGKGGFTVELSRSRRKAVAQIASMEQDYIDGATRAVAVSWNIYNPNEDIFTVAQVIFVFHPTGHVEPYARLAPLRLMRDFFFTNTAFESLAFSIMIVLVLYFFAKEVFELLAHGPMVYFAEFWNLYELLDIWCFAKAILAMDSYHELSMTVAEDLRSDENQEHYYDMMASESVRAAYRTMKMWMALNAMTAVLKVFKYLQISNKMNSLWEVLQRAFFDILAFVIILLFILGGFGVFACVLFGDHVRSFHNIPSSLHTLLYFSIGDFSNVDYELMKQANSALAPVFIGLFLVLVVLVALNMFIAILTDTYEVYKDEKTKEQRDRHSSKTADAASFSVLKRVKMWLDGLTPHWKIQVKETAPLLQAKASDTIADELLHTQQQADTSQIISGRNRLQTSIGASNAAAGSAAEAVSTSTRQEDDKGGQTDFLQTRRFLLAKGMKVRMHIGRSHVTKDSVSQLHEHARMNRKGEEELRLDPQAAPTLVEMPEGYRRTPSSMLAPRFVSVAHAAEGTEEDVADGKSSTATRLSRGKRAVQRSHSLHFIDTAAEHGDEEGQSMALEHTVVLGMLTLRKSATEGYTMPSSTARMLICELRPDEEIEIRDPTGYLGDVVALRFKRVPPLVQTVAHDLMTGNDVIRRDTYAEFEVVRVNTLTPVQLPRGRTPKLGVGGEASILGSGCEIDTNTAQLCLPYQLYARLSARLMCTRLRAAWWSAIVQSCKSCCSSQHLKLQRLFTRRCIGKQGIDDLIEEFLDDKLRHIKSSGSAARNSYDDGAYELMKRSYAQEDVNVSEVALHIRHANSRKMTKARALARRKSYAAMRKDVSVQEMQLAVTRYLDGIDIDDVQGSIEISEDMRGRNAVELMAISQVDEYLRSKYSGAIRYEP